MWGDRHREERPRVLLQAVVDLGFLEVSQNSRGGNSEQDSKSKSPTETPVNIGEDTADGI